MNDNIKHPAHYTDGGIETIDFIRAKLTPEEFAGYCKGNALKYISRAGKKGDAAEDLAKAIVQQKAQHLAQFSAAVAQLQQRTQLSTISKKKGYTRRNENRIVSDGSRRPAHGTRGSHRGS